MASTEYDPFDESAQAEAEAREELKRQRDDEEFLKLTADPMFRRFLWRLWENTGVFRSSYQERSGIYFREGERNVGLRYLSKVNELCPEVYERAMREAIDVDKET